MEEDEEELGSQAPAGGWDSVPTDMGLMKLQSRSALLLIMHVQACSVGIYVCVTTG